MSDLSCISCGEGLDLHDCAASQRLCGHHCNHTWSHDTCCWCGLPPLSEDRKCPACQHPLAYDDGAYYCDCTHGETFNCVCELALARWPCP